MNKRTKPLPPEDPAILNGIRMLLELADIEPSLKYVTKARAKWLGMTTRARQKTRFKYIDKFPDRV